MLERIERLFSKYSIKAENILYCIHTNYFTYIYLIDCHEVRTKIPLKYFLEFLPKGDFHSIAKGIIVAERHIMKIEDSGLYTMTDGKELQGSKNKLAFHKRLRKAMEKTKEDESKKYIVSIATPSTIYEKCSIMEEAPIAFCIIELIFGEHGRGMDFIFRYCNKEMAVLEGIPVENMINKSFYEVFPNGDKKWIVPYADVALNGAKRVLNEYSPEVDKNLIIHCFQPEYRFCACILSENKL